MKNIIHIFGASGSGTTTLGKKICAELGYRHMDTDDYFWLPTDPKFIEKRPAEERLAMMKRDINEAENVVISGALAGWGDPLIPYFTLAVRIELPQDVRIERLRKREKERFGSRIEPGGDMYKLHVAFIEWAKTYDTGGMAHRSKMRHDAWQTHLPCELFLLDGVNDPDTNFRIIAERLQR
ncbi:MAG: AAA family ATPase [Clostridia bacterium]|nr:AAA family ATPase [Clostridia bacterium]